jgi:hypothetical protein
MIDDPSKRWRCTECDHVCTSSQILTGPNPFDAEDTLSGCPTCKSVNAFEEMCEWPECRRTASNGTPLADGRYVRRCHEHRPEAMGESQFTRKPGVDWDSVRKDK